MNIVFFGTSEFALPSVFALAKSDLFEISLVVTLPDKPAGRKKALTPPSIKTAAQKLGLTVIQPEKLKPETLRKICDPEIIIVVSYGTIIPSRIMNMAPHGAINIHPSLLPQYRGPSPIQTALLNNDTHTGITIMRIDEKIDHGPIIAQSEKIQIEENETYPQLSRRLADRGAQLLIKILPKYLSGTIVANKQDHDKATFTKMIKKEDGKIDWNKTADDIRNMLRAYTPWPGIYTFAGEKRIKIIECLPVHGTATKPDNSSQPGHANTCDTGALFVTCGKNTTLRVITLQPEGKKPMAAKEFIKGNRIEQFDE